MAVEKHPVGPLLVVEDDEGEWRIIKLLLRGSGFRNEIIHCSTGEQALAYVTRQHESKPSHVLLDLNLPGMSGLEVLGSFRRDPGLADVPITILSSSSHPRDVEESYRTGANSYLRKPVDFVAFERLIDGFTSFWFGVATFLRSSSVGPSGVG